MSYYVIVKSTGHIVTDGPNSTRSYRSQGAAQATRTRLCRKQGWSLNDLEIVDHKSYQPRMVTRTNIMTGEQYEEDVNTPRFCSPSSEAFWSM